MSLPKTEYPLHNIKIPSLKKNMKFRPFLVKEEKLLLMSKESTEETDYLSAIKQIVNNCCMDKNFDIDNLATFDIEYIFLKLRALSVDNIVKLSYIDNEDGEKYDFDIDLNNIEVKFPDKIKNTIKINESMGIIMKYPSSTLFEDKEFLTQTKEYLFELIIKCIDKIYENDTVYNTKDYSKEEIVEFVENLSVKTFNEINQFLNEMPRISYVIKYKNKLNNDRNIPLESLSDFFM